MQEKPPPSKIPSKQWPESGPRPLEGLKGLNGLKENIGHLKEEAAIQSNPSLRYFPLRAPYQQLPVTGETEKVRERGPSSTPTSTSTSTSTSTPISTLTD
jgi:hypothetical protein